MSQPNTNPITENESPSSASPFNVRKFADAEVEMGCINLISQLEMQASSAKSRSDHVEQAGENTDKLLSALLEFSDEFLVDDSHQRAMDAVEKASYASLAHKEVLSTRSWGFAIRNLLGKAAVSDESIKETYTLLGEALLAACVSVLREAVAIVGSESTAGRTVEQSIAIFVEELKANW